MKKILFLILSLFLFISCELEYDEFVFDICHDVKFVITTPEECLPVSINFNVAGYVGDKIISNQTENIIVCRGCIGETAYLSASGMMVNVYDTTNNIINLKIYFNDNLICDTTGRLFVETYSLLEFNLFK